MRYRNDIKKIMSKSLQDFFTEQYNQGCNKFNVNTHITPSGVIKVGITGSHTETDGIVSVNSLILIQNVKIGEDRRAGNI